MQGRQHETDVNGASDNLVAQVDWRHNLLGFRARFFFAELDASSPCLVGAGGHAAIDDCRVFGEIFVGDVFCPRRCSASNLHRCAALLSVGFNARLSEYGFRSDLLGRGSRSPNALVLDDQRRPTYCPDGASVAPYFTSNRQQ